MVEKLLTKLRGKDYRPAYRAIPQLCKLDDGSLAGIIASYKPKDDQRRFQYELARIALTEGIVGLTKQWLRLGSAEQRAVLLQEIGPDWDHEWKVEIAIAALEEPDDKVRGYAVVLAKYAAPRGISADQRARMTQGLVRAMARHNDRPLELLWLQWYVELLGLTANASVSWRLRSSSGCVHFPARRAAPCGRSWIRTIFPGRPACWRKRRACGRWRRSGSSAPGCWKSRSSNPR